MIYRARHLVPMDGPPLSWGCIRVRDGRIADVGTLNTMGREQGEQVRDFPDGVLLPGLINAHCHLELGMARGLLPRGEAFPMWVSRLRKSLEGTATDQYGEAARLGILECLKHGTTTVVDVGNSGAALPELAALPIRAFAYLEMIGIAPAVAEDRMRAARAALAALPPPSDRFHPGLTAHAPYSCSPALLKLAMEDAAARGLPFTLHLAESAEESAMFAEGRGTLLEFCRRIHPALDLGPPASPTRWLNRHGLLGQAERIAGPGDPQGRSGGSARPGPLFAHCNGIDGADVRLLAEARASVAHCPRSKAFFNHGGFPLESLRRAGVNLCLGTDSLASNEGLSLFDEMAEFQRAYPGFAGRDILAMATLNPAKALGIEGELGVLTPGAHADFIVLGLRSASDGDIYEEIVGEAHEVLFAAVGGEEVVS